MEPRTKLRTRHLLHQFCMTFLSERDASNKTNAKKSLVRSFIQGSWLKWLGLKPSWIVVLFTLNACCTIVSIFFNPFSWHVKNLPSQRILCESTKNKLPVRLIWLHSSFRQFIMHEKGGHSKVNVFFSLLYLTFLLFIYLNMKPLTIQCLNFSRIIKAPHK